MVLGDVFRTANGSEGFLVVGREANSYQVRVPDLWEVHLSREELPVNPERHHLPIPFAWSEEGSSRIVSMWDTLSEPYIVVLKTIGNGRRCDNKFMWLYDI